MSQKLVIKNIFLGILSWLIPFAVSFLFYKPGGELVVPYATFKSTIMLVGVVSGCYLLYRYFKFVESDYLLQSIVVGFSWFAINIVLDTIVLIPMMKTTFVDYFLSIGLSYIGIPVISIAMGYLLKSKLKL
ncbi:MAG: hypothetical protein IPP32_09810 [Bacteroidetes bacterium]|nr:hypothetical protein [Bacteroidota bacterium]